MKRKYKRGRLLDRDKQSEGETGARKLSSNDLAEWNDIHEWRTDIPEDEVDLNKNMKSAIYPTGHANYGQEVSGPWVVRRRTDKFYVRFVIVADRSVETLVKLIHEHVQHSPAVVTDEWKGCILLKYRGYMHESVNHPQNFVNPNTEYNTQSIERN